MSVDIKKSGNENLDEALDSCVSKTINVKTKVRVPFPKKVIINEYCPIKIRHEGKTRVGEKYNKLTIIGPEFLPKIGISGRNYWVVTQCECGEYYCIDVSSIIRGNNMSCSVMCSVGIKPDIKIGYVNSRLTTISEPYTSEVKDNRRDWLINLKCECGWNGAIETGWLQQRDTWFHTGCELHEIDLKPDIHVGFKTNYISVISEPHKSDFIDKNNYWLVDVECKCGWKGKIRADLLITRNNYQSHLGCESVIKDKYYIGSVSLGKFSQIKIGADARHLEFKVTREFLNDLWIQQNGRCSMTGWKIYLDKYNSPNGKITASLDRIDSSKGYVPGNVWWVHKDIQRLKRELLPQQLIDYCYLIFTYKSRTFEKLEIQLFPFNEHLFQGEGNITKSYYEGIRSSCLHKRISKKRPNGINCDVSIQDIWSFFVKQNSRCNATGMPIYHKCPGATEPGYIRQPKEGTASLDRIDSNLGYTPSNIQWLHIDINNIKWDFTMDRFMEIATAIALNNWSSENVEYLLQPVEFKFCNNKQIALSKVGPRSGKYKGVSANKNDNQPYRSRFKNVLLGKFKSEIDAAKNYDYHAIQIYGNGCYLNFPDFDYSTFIPQNIIDCKKYKI